MAYQTKSILLVLFILWFSAAINADPKAKWTFTTGGPVYSSPTYSNGNVYIGSDDGNLYCIDANSGINKWEFKTGGIIRCKPAISNGTVYFSSDDGNLYSVNASSGIKNWSFNIGNNVKRVLPDLTTTIGYTWDYMQSSPCIDSGTVYIGSGDKNLYSIDALNGNLKWKAVTKGYIRSSPCIYFNNVYVGSLDGYIYSFKKSDGSAVWSYNTQVAVVSTPCITDSMLYCGSRSSFFYAINAITGKLVWKYSLNGSWVESSATFANGNVYVGSSDNNAIYSFNAKTGKNIWISHVTGTTWSSPVIDGNNLYIGLASYNQNSLTAKQGGAILAINISNGSLNWRFNCGTTSFIGGIASSPAIVDNVVYYGSLDGNIYAVENTATSVENHQGNSNLPNGYHLANYPNPFNPSTIISYQLPKNSMVSLKVYDGIGREVAELINDFRLAGSYKVNFEGRGSGGSYLSSGVYFYTLIAGDFIQTNKMLLLK